MKTSTHTIVIAVLCGLFLVPQLEANLILNGSFEAPGLFGSSGFGPGRQQYSAPSVALTNWTVAGGGDVFLHKAPEIGIDVNPSFNSAQHGNFYLDLSGSYKDSAHATIYQEFSTIPFAAYELSFFIGASNQTLPTTSINVQLDGATLLLNTTLTPLPPSTNIEWSLQTFSFVADSTTTRLSFKDISTLDDNTSFVDNVSVVPEPRVGILFLFGAAICSYRRKLRGSSTLRRIPPAERSSGSR